MGNIIKQTTLPDFAQLSVITATSGAEIAFSKSLSLQKQKEGDVRVFLVDAIIHANDYLSVPKMTEAQVVKTVNLLMSSPHYMELKPEDFALCFNRALSGRYGKVFNRLDGMVITEWLNQYIVEREQEIIEANIRKKEKRGGDLSIIDERMAKKFGELAHKLQVKKIKEEKPRERTGEEKQIDAWMAEFNSLSESQGLDKQPIKFVLYNEKHIDCREFLEMKLTELLDKGEEPIK